MATAKPPAPPEPPDDSGKPGKQPLAPHVRRRLQQCFDHGSKMAASGNFDYATELYTQCVVGDPANAIYLQNFIFNLQKKYNNNKSGSKLAGVKGMGIKGSIKKASMQKDFTALLTNGLEMLKLNPWDAGALTDMVRACKELEYDDCLKVYLKAALDGNLKDPELNRIAGRELGRLGEFDNAIACWHRVVLAKPGDEEAQRAIGNLSVEKTIKKGGYEDAESGNDVKKLNKTDDQDRNFTPEQLLERAIKRDPNDINKYIELCELHLKFERWDQAEATMQRAIQAQPGNINVRERVEDLQLRRAREQLLVAEKQVQIEKTPQAEQLAQKLKVELNIKELEVYRNRCDRYPTNLGFKYELALRLKRAKNYSEAIKMFQDARNDSKRKGSALLELGECFQMIKQYKLAMGSYEQAAKEISEREEDLKKLALYRCGVLAMGLKTWDIAEKYLTELAGFDFGYKDVSERLDKIARLREDDGPGESEE
jgi:tetratricopeptide (TPR) repeat protein